MGLHHNGTSFNVQLRFQAWPLHENSVGLLHNVQRLKGDVAHGYFRPKTMFSAQIVATAVSDTQICVVDHDLDVIRLPDRWYCAAWRSSLDVHKYREHV